MLINVSIWKWLERQKLEKLIQEEVDNPNNPISIKECNSNIKNILQS